MSPPPSQFKTRLIFAVKVLVAVGMIAYLVRSGKVDFGALRVVLASPTMMAADLGTWLACSIALSVIRWRLLLGAIGCRVSVPKAVAIQMIALFFNVVVPGNIGGDVLKALYVARTEGPEKRAPLLLLVFVERFVGLSGLVAIAGLFMVARLDVLWADPAFRPMVTVVGFFLAGFLFAPALAVVVVRRHGDWVESKIPTSSKLGALLSRFVAAARLVSSRPGVLLGALGISMVLHAVGFLLFVFFTKRLTGQDVSYGAIASIYPTGLLSMMLPVAQAGLGVGHVAFDRLFAAVGLTGGATVFNVFMLGQLTPSLLGVVPYIFLRSSLPKSDPAPDASEPKG